jgi:hypothetical protein
VTDEMFVNSKRFYIVKLWTCNCSIVESSELVQVNCGWRNVSQS